VLTVSTPTGTTKGTLRRREFFDEIVDTVQERLPAGMQKFNHRQTMNLLKVHYGANYRVHYEVSFITEIGLIEVGLHFEDGPESTTRLLQHFDQYIVEIKHLLGQQCELERWTKSWGHLYEVYPIGPLTPAFARQLAGRLALMIETLQPILDDAYDLGLVSHTPRPSTFRPRFRR
jgi:hypothetical protein